MIKTAIVGATGYTGSELVRILVHHPDVEIKLITSESRAGEKFSDVHPQFLGICDMELQPAENINKHDVDLAFLALPHRVSMSYVKKWKDHSFRMIDLSGDYRLSGPEVYEKWYEKAHETPSLVEQVPYGLPELERERIKDANLVANPGCYPTASTLALAPLFKDNIIKKGTVIIDAKSGTTGAGVKVKPNTHFSNVNDNFKAYGLKSHRHTIEIEERLSGLCGEEMKVQFTPHLLPVDRGILATAYATPLSTTTEREVQQRYEDFYKDEPFVRMRSTAPELKSVRGTNLCDIYVTYDERTHRIIALSAIDNLVKGAAGQAVQNMNIMFGLDEDTALNISPMQP